MGRHVSFRVWVGLVGPRVRLACVCFPLFAVLCAPAGALAASVQISDRAKTYTLTGNLNLDPNDTFDAEGTADSPCVIQGNQFQITARLSRGRSRS